MGDLRGIFNSESVPLFRYSDAHAYKQTFALGVGRVDDCGHCFSNSAEQACRARIFEVVRFGLRNDRIDESRIVRPEGGGD